MQQLQARRVLIVGVAAAPRAAALAEGARGAGGGVAAAQQGRVTRHRGVAAPRGAILAVLPRRRHG